MPPWQLPIPSLISAIETEVFSGLITSLQYVCGFFFPSRLNCLVVQSYITLGQLKQRGRGGKGGGGYRHEFMHNNFAFHKSQNK